MPRCPNCSYILVLLEKRGKYKCAKCSKLFLRKEVESKEFREYNKRQKETDKEEFDKQLKLRRKTLKPRKRKEISPEEKLERQKKLKEYKLAYYKENKDRSNLIRNNYRARFKDQTKLLWRLDYWRRKQRDLALDIAYTALDICR